MSLGYQFVENGILHDVIFFLLPKTKSCVS